jgi:hypothetical protein
VTPVLEALVIQDAALLLGAGLALGFAKAGVLKASIGRPSQSGKSAPRAAQAPADPAGEAPDAPASPGAPGQARPSLRKAGAA